MNDRLGKSGQAFASQGSETRGGIALINVNNRIHLLFGEEYGFMYSPCRELGQMWKSICLPLPMTGT